MADRFFCPGAARGGRITLEGAEAAHLARVSRIGPGETVVLFDGEGFATNAVVREVGRREVELDTVGPPLPDRLPSIALTLATAPPKGDRFDWLVEKATELGVDHLVPILTERTVVDPREAKLERLRRTVVEASKQCGRNRLMTIEATMPWSEFLQETRAETRLVADQGGDCLPEERCVRRGGSVILAVGPEGGFTEAEIARARSEGWVLVALGATRLRVETAGLVGCARLLAAGERNAG